MQLRALDSSSISLLLHSISQPLELPFLYSLKSRRCRPQRASQGFTGGTGQCVPLIAPQFTTLV
jgi:hypothetical protein